jgi:hypothetical protein
MVTMEAKGKLAAKRELASSIAGCESPSLESQARTHPEAVFDPITTAIKGKRMNNGLDRMKWLLK